MVGARGPRSVHLRAGRGARRPRAGGAGDAAAKDRLSAVLLSPPAPRSDPRRRPDHRAAATTCARPASEGPDARRGRAPARPAARAGPRGAARSVAARDDVRLRTARLGGDRARAGRRSTWRRGSSAPAARAPRSESCRSDAKAIATLRTYLEHGSARASSGPRDEPRVFVNQRGAGSRARACTRSSSGTRAPRGWSTG